MEKMSVEDAITQLSIQQMLNMQRIFTNTSNAKVDAIDTAIESLKFQKEYQDKDWRDFYNHGYCRCEREYKKKVQKCIERLQGEKFIEQETILTDVHQGFNSGIEFATKIIKEEMGCFNDR